MDSLDVERGMDGLAENDLVDEAEVDSVIRETVLHTVGETAFAQAKVNGWSGQIVEGCLKKLAGMGKPFKYVITCSITQVSQDTLRLEWSLFLARAGMAFPAYLMHPYDIPFSLLAEGWCRAPCSLLHAVEPKDRWQAGGALGE